MQDIGYTLACGDGVVVAGEACDDGNNLDGDGCGRACTVETCWACAGSPSACAPLPNGTGCDDLNLCTGPDTCQAGTCQRRAARPAPPATTVTPAPQATPASARPAAARFPLSSCIAPDVPARAFVQLSDDGNDERDAVLWRWIRGTTLVPQFGNPTLATPYTLCVHDAADGSLMSLFVPPGPNWRATADRLRLHGRLAPERRRPPHRPQGGHRQREGPRARQGPVARHDGPRAPSTCRSPSS